MPRYRLVPLVPLVLLAGVAWVLAACDAGGPADRAPTDREAPGAPGASGAGSPDAGPAESTASGEARDPVALCDTITNSFRCARAIEDHQLATAPRAERRGDTLYLALAGGDTIRLVDRSGDGADVVHYSYQDHWTGSGYFVIHQQFYEGSQHVLVDDSAGGRTVVPDRPVPAPGASRFAVLSLDLVAGYGPNVLQIWSLTDDGPEREWETAPGKWGPTDGRWLDSTTLRFTQRGYCGALGGSGRTLCSRYATLRRVEGDWQLEVGRPDAEG